MVFGFWRSWGLCVLAASAGAACSHHISSHPLGKVEPEADDFYYYGPAQPYEREPVSEAHKAAARKTGRKSNKKSAEGKTPAEPSSGTAESPPVPVGEVKSPGWAGLYEGTDRVVFALGDRPANPQVDERAKLRVVQDGEEVTFTVIDSGNGGDLCSLSGAAAEGRVELKSGEACFAGMLGVPMTTELTSGHATLKGDSIEVRFDLDVSLTTGALTLEGDIEYEFDGERAKAKDD